MKFACFVTGSDTGVGKTFVASALLHAARAAGFSAVGMKPVASGMDFSGKNEDVERLFAASSLKLPREIINPYCLKRPIAPHLAAREEGVSILFSVIKNAFDAIFDAAEVVVVEGVGGFLVPLGKDGDSADLAVALDLPMILVVGIRLGCINHALLTAEAIAARKLTLAGWVANHLDPGMECALDNQKTLARVLPAPLLGAISHASSPQDAARHLEGVWGTMRL